MNYRIYKALQSTSTSLEIFSQKPNAGFHLFLSFLVLSVLISELRFSNFFVFSGFLSFRRVLIFSYRRGLPELFPLPQSNFNSPNSSVDLKIFRSVKAKFSKIHLHLHKLSGSRSQNFQDDDVDHVAKPFRPRRREQQFQTVDSLVSSILFLHFPPLVVHLPAWTTLAHLTVIALQDTECLLTVACGARGVARKSRPTNFMLAHISVLLKLSLENIYLTRP